MQLLSSENIASLELPVGRLYAPCSGRDLPLAFRLFGDKVDRFTFCDLNYGQRDTSADYAVPDGWEQVSRVMGRDERQEPKTTWYAGGRPFQPFVTIEIWRRLDGSEVTVELRRNLAQDTLVQQFARETISVFLHVNDGAGEGGSNLWFLAAADRHNRDPQSLRLLPETASRLINGALVVTDAVLADPGFQHTHPFEAAGLQWEPIGRADNVPERSRPVFLWRARRESHG